MSGRSAAVRVSDDEERPRLYVVGGQCEPLPADVMATLRIVAEIMLAKRRREQRDALTPGTDVVNSDPNTEGRDRATGRGPSPNPE